MYASFGWNPPEFADFAMKSKDSNEICGFQWHPKIRTLTPVYSDFEICGFPK